MNEPIVNESSEYEKFHILKGSQALSERHIDGLVHSFKEIGQINPIAVDESYNILDGIHRFAACRALGIPVKFFVVRNAERRKNA